MALAVLGDQVLIARNQLSWGEILHDSTSKN